MVKEEWLLSWYLGEDMLIILERGLIGDKIAEQGDVVIGESCDGVILLDDLFIQFMGQISNF